VSFQTNQSSRPWTRGEIPPQRARTVLVTGANSGTGFETAKALAENGARVVLGCRDTAKGEDAAARIRATLPTADLSVLPLDLASLASVREAARRLRSTRDRLDLLIANAGLGWVPYARTADGFELTFGTNHLGHFALTGLLLDLMLAVPGSRVVAVTSPAHRQARMNFGDLQSEKRYSRGGAYGQSKLANLLFAYELQRRLAAAVAKTIALAAHPGGRAATSTAPCPCSSVAPTTACSGRSATLRRSARWPLSVPPSTRMLAAGSTTRP
jgi:NAD(P)-dependent dehydrogenase (short-subunit alcohol dehydrogenase family)